ncbi:hypothetical protein RJ639_037554 [Escallonia herrerae]|uniref:DNA (cytosine-5-)-methyltransferase n=1 Tax=Escallonia herrerae TaxID=1293975 RepID=A0AA88X145_9ASTE|nr:hypothetical protein RJ639_037554 [Escallonia herrerae]
MIKHFPQNTDCAFRNVVSPSSHSEKERLTSPRYDCQFDVLSFPFRAKLTDKVKKALELSKGEPSPEVKKYVIEQCKKWNSVWVGRNKVAPLEPDEMEQLMGFPCHRSRGFSRTARYKTLGNSFQVDTVAHHLSVLKNMFPSGMNVLSLFSRIGGAEVALHRLGIPLNYVVSVEILPPPTCQGHLIQFTDVQEVIADKVEQWIRSCGGFDLVIGGSPCHNLAGGNRVSRHGHEEENSSLSFDYFRILNLVEFKMRNQH